MRITATQDFAFWDPQNGRLERSKGQTADVSDEIAQQAIDNGWATEAPTPIPKNSPDDAGTGAPKRNKKAAAGAPKKG